LSNQYSDPLWIEHGYGTRFQGFQNLMRRRIRDVLLVSSFYDLYFFEKDGRLYDLVRKEYQALDLTHSPEFTHVSSGREAIELVKTRRRYDLIITTLHIEDMSATAFARLARESGVDLPIVLLACDSRELKDIATRLDTSVFDRIFIWQGDFRLMIGIIKHLEDRMNLEDDTRLAGVQSILLIEDNIPYYSYFLPVIYTEILTQSHRLLSDGINLSHRYLRTRARPKILLCENYEEAWQYFEKYSDYILGIISDIVFPRGGVMDPRAGFTFAQMARKRHPHLPVLLQSIAPEFEPESKELGTSFILKGSPAALLKLRQFTTDYFSFGDFIFRTPDGHEVGRAADLNSLEEQLQIVPDESYAYHAERNDFSNWFKARTEFLLAYKVRPLKIADFPSISDMRQDLIASLGEYRRQQQRGVITDFSKENFDPETGFARIGGGSLGGKARGLGFVNILINNYDLLNKFEGTRISVPPAVVLGTEVFDQFLDENNLRAFALKSKNDAEIARRFIEARSFPDKILGDLAAFLDLITEPLAVRSSSLLEDSQYHPFAGVYETYMIPNNHPDRFVRLSHLVHTIKRVYASTFYQSSKEYIKATAYRLEEEKMAVVIQRIVGAQHEHRFYPAFSGVAKSYNFYPVQPEKPNDGVVAVCLGLGKQIVDGGVSVRFCPKYPNHLLQYSSAADAMRNNQNEFFALDLRGQPLEGRNTVDELVQTFGLKVAEEDNTLQYSASTYLPENDALYEGLSRKGLRVVTFAPILKNKIFPLPQILNLLLDMGCWGMGTPIELEFAVNMSVPGGKPKEFGLLQMRPLVVSQEIETLDVEETDPADLICHSNQALGHGIVDGIVDIVVVDMERFERSKSQDVALEVAQLNEKLTSEGRHYVLIGVGRWGSLDPWLGIPVRWNQISGAKVIVEASFKDLDVDPSQGSHFFQNVTSSSVGYFTINPRIEDGFVDWNWLRNQVAAEEKRFVRHIQLGRPVIIKIDGRRNKGIIIKPE
jgi:CheY-like chemotaxis protein